MSVYRLSTLMLKLLYTLDTIAFALHGGLKMRMALLGVAHETNTFSRIPASHEEFEKTGMLHGENHPGQHAGRDNV